MDVSNPKGQGVTFFRAVALTVAIAFAVAGCGPDLRGYRAFDLAVGDTSRVDLALESAVQSFLDIPSGGRGGGTSAGSSGASSGGSIFDTGGGTRIDRGRARKTGVVLGARQPVGKRGHLSHELGLFRLSSDYGLPDGAGVLTDPILVRFDTTAVSAETRYLHPLWPGGSHVPQGIAGAGLQLAHTRVRLDSALLAVDHSSTALDPFLSLGLHVPIVGTARASIGIQVVGRIYGPERAAYVWGLRAGF